MSTMTRAEAARLNGAKSRGPATEEGKQRSSLNAVRHGLRAQSLCLNHENPEEYKHLLDDFVARFQPVDNVELRLVEQMASAALRLERLAGIEVSLFEREMNLPATQAAPDDAARVAMAFQSLSSHSASLQLYLRYEAAITRQYDRALKELLTLRTKFAVTAEAELPNEPNGPPADTHQETPELAAAPAAPPPTVGNPTLTPTILPGSSSLGILEKRL